MRSLFYIISCIFLSACIEKSSFGIIKSQPNIIIILTDDQGWRDVSFNGSTDLKTPQLDDLADAGVIFTDGYASHPYCSPSRAGLLTGRYQQRFGHENNTPYKNNYNDSTVGLPLNELMLSEILKTNGYSTCAIGKWHLGEHPSYLPPNRGFDYWYGFSGGGLNYWGDISKKSPHLGVMQNGQPVCKNRTTYLTDDFTNEAIKYIKHNKNDKFFMYLAYNAPHGPFQVPSKYLQRTDHIEDGERAVYAAMIKAVDSGVGKIRETLKETGLLDQTLIFFYSDNGGMSYRADNGPFRGYKGMMFEGGIRVPFFVTWPDVIERGKKYNEPIIGLDVFPTVLSAAGIEHPDSIHLDGINLLPYLTGEKKGSPHERLFWRYSGGPGYAVREGRYKLVREEVKKRTYLFDLETDSSEINDLSMIMPDKVADLQSKYETWNKEMVQPLWSDPHMKNVAYDREKRKAIIQRALSGEK